MNFQQFLRVLSARKWVAIGTFLFVVLATLALSLLMPKQYTAESQLVIDIKSNDPISGQQQQLPMSSSSYVATQVDIIESHNTALKVVDMLGLDKLPEANAQFQEETKGNGTLRDWLADSIGKNLEVKPARESNVVTLTYTSTDPKFAAAMANAFSQAYIRTVVDIRTAAAEQNSSFFREQLKGLEKNLEDAQNELADYQQKQGIVATDERLDVETQRLSEITSQHATALAEVYDSQSRARTARAGGESSPDVVNNPLIQQLKSQITQQEAALSELGQKLGASHPKYAQMQAQLNSTKQELQQQTRLLGGSLERATSTSLGRQEALQHALRAQKNRILELKSQRAKLEVLQGEVANAQRAYDLALQRFSEVTMESRSNFANVASLKDAPQPLAPSKPNLVLNMILAVFFGGFLAVNAAVLVEAFNRKIRSSSDLEKALDLPVLAVLGKTPLPRYAR